MQTGSHQKILEALDLHHEVSNKLSDDTQKQVFDLMKDRAVATLKEMTDFFQKRQEERLHYMESSSVHGVISIAKYISMVGVTEFTSSLTVDSQDGAYLYLWISMPSRGNMYKIGTGESGTQAGRIYACQSQPEKEGEVTWVHCQGKLWARRVNEGSDLGHLLVFDPATLKLESTAKIPLNLQTNSGDDPIKASLGSLNKYYPLLTDGRNLFAITVQLATKRRRVKDSMRREYQTFQEEKKRRKTEQAKAPPVPVEAKPQDKSGRR